MGGPAKHSSVYRIAPSLTTKNYQAPNLKTSKVEKFCTGQNFHFSFQYNL